MVNLSNYYKIKKKLPDYVKLVAVSKTKPVEDILALYCEGERSFGENKAQELKAKHEALPKDIEWHFIGHLQSNKIKYIAPFVSLIHSIDSLKLLREVNSQAMKNDRVIPCLLQIHIALEDTKFGFSMEECEAMLADPVMRELKNVVLAGVMGMATFTDDEKRIRGEFARLKGYFDQLKTNYFHDNPDFKEISMGMTDDYPIAVEEGSTLVRIGNAIFGSRTK